MNLYVQFHPFLRRFLKKTKNRRFFALVPACQPNEHSVFPLHTGFIIAPPCLFTALSPMRAEIKKIIKPTSKLNFIFIDI